MRSLTSLDAWLSAQIIKRQISMVHALLVNLVNTSLKNVLVPIVRAALSHRTEKNALIVLTDTLQKLDLLSVQSALEISHLLTTSVQAVLLLAITVKVEIRRLAIAKIVNQALPLTTIILLVFLVLATNTLINLLRKRVRRVLIIHSQSRMKMATTSVAELVVRLVNT